MSTASEHKIRPFLKWAGNKFRCLNQILPRLPLKHRLIEPFAGSGAIFLNSRFREYILNDKNPDLIQLYLNLKLHHQDFIDYCALWFKPENNQKDVFYSIRKQFNESKDPFLRSALFLYLNRHGYNGLCRYNLKGQYNVPFGRYIHPYFPRKELEGFVQKSHLAHFMQNDFVEVFKEAQAGDVIYCDPPYAPLSRTANFTNYTKGNFLETDQQKLLQCAQDACLKGVHVMISNHDTNYTRQLYRDAHQIHAFPVARSIACQGKKRVPVMELLAYFKPS
jgi:DNA adenine methylase